jgi:hypothetical protein
VVGPHGLGQNHQGFEDQIGRLVGALALLFDLAFSGVNRLTTSKGIRS